MRRGFRFRLLRMRCRVSGEIDATVLAHATGGAFIIFGCVAALPTVVQFAGGVDRAAALLLRVNLAGRWTTGTIIRVFDDAASRISD